MGADIHLFAERNWRGRWVMSHAVEGAGAIRNYARFGRLANVRGDGPEPRGLPENISESVRMHADDWRLDGHSHSWLPLDEAVVIFSETDVEPSKWPESHYFGIDNPALEWRIVFWFDS